MQSTQTLLSMDNGVEQPISSVFENLVLDHLGL